MNFAYNYINNITKLKATLLNQFMRDENDVLEVSSIQTSRHSREEKYYRESSNKLLCKIVFNPKGVFYYEPKGSQDTV